MTTAEILESEADGRGRLRVRVKYVFDDGFVHITGHRMVPDDMDVQAMADARIPAMEASRQAGAAQDINAGFEDRATERFQDLLDRSRDGETLPTTAFVTLRDKLNEYAAAQ